MTYIATPKLHHPSLRKNAVGYTRRDYEGKVSTLCAGCGHDSVSAAIVQACWQLDIAPHRVAKLSGIGCSSKTPDYFLGASHGFNTVHGRMPSVLTGANLANRDRIAAMNQIHALAAAGEIATGLLYVDPQARDMHHGMNTVAKPLNALAEAALCPGAAQLARINAGLR